jgi:hypothetical protein
MSVTSARDWQQSEQSHSDRVPMWVTAVTVALLALGFSRSRASYPAGSIPNAARWPAVNYSPHESSACRHDIGSPRSTVTVRGFALPFQIYPIEQPARYRIATPTSICCGTM